MSSFSSIASENTKDVLILIILEVLYERYKLMNVQIRKGLNPYYTGSTLWEAIIRMYEPLLSRS